jgi:hypothetical protein
MRRMHEAGVFVRFGFVSVLLLAALPATAQQKKPTKQKQAVPQAQVEPAAQNPVGEGDVKPNPATTEGGAEAATPDAQGRRTSLESRLILKVINPDDARATLEKKVAELGGFPILVEDASLVLKVPPDKLSDLIAFIADQGLVLEKTLERADLTQEIARLEGQLKSKKEVLARLRGFFDDSNTEATLRIEQTMTSIVAEIEQIKGQLRVADERAKWAMVDISFQFHERDKIVYVSSPFEWLNSVSLDRFLGEF